MKDPDELKATKYQPTAVEYFKSIFLLTLFISFLIIYIASEYFQNANLSQLISFQAWDKPAPLPNVLYPDPFGNHYFGDFLLTFRTIQQPSPYFAEGFLPFSYLPFSAVLLGPFVLFNYWVALVLFFSICISSLIVIIRSGLCHLQKSTRRLIFLMLMISGPMFSMFDRANVSFILTLFCLFGAINLQRSNNYRAAIAFGIAAAMKGYPLLFLMIFVRRREWKQLATGISTFLICTLMPLLFYQNGFAANFKELVNQFRGASTSVHAIKIRAYNQSLLSFFDTCRTSLPDIFTNLFSFLCEHYSIFGLLFAALLLSHAVSKYASDFQSLLLAAVCMTSIPQTVGYYVLLLYFVPLVFCWSGEKRLNLELKLIMLALAIVMVPKGVPLWSPFGFWSPAAATYASFINPLCALFISSVCIYCINRKRFLCLKKRVNCGDNLQD